MNYISVCKNVIQSNNKKGWINADPAIRISRTKSGKAVARGFTVAIKDAAGNTVARIHTTKDGKALIKAGAKVVIETLYDVEVVE